MVRPPRTQTPCGAWLAFALIVLAAAYCCSAEEGQQCAERGLDLNHPAVVSWGGHEPKLKTAWGQVRVAAVRPLQAARGHALPPLVAGRWLAPFARTHPLANALPPPLQRCIEYRKVCFDQQTIVSYDPGEACRAAPHVAGLCNGVACIAARAAGWFPLYTLQSSAPAACRCLQRTAPAT